MVDEAMSEEFRMRLADIPPVAAQLLWTRGIRDVDEARTFLEPKYERDLHDPFLFRHMERACERVWNAMENGERVIVHGDYDADGVTGSTVLLSTFRETARLVGADDTAFGSYIPHREHEGYGLRTETVEKLAADGASLIITVDCGISCAPEIARATELGVDTIVVDHHQIPERIPECIILHPLVEGETYPFKKLAAVGVAFKFACGFIAYAARKGVALPAGFDKWLLDLVAIATVTDFMPLVGENRALEKYGLVVLNRTKRIGLRKLIEAAGLKYGDMDTVSVGFSIGPRINAASRMDHADAALRTLLAETPEEATVLAEALNQLNRDRQKYTEEIMAAARKQLAEMGDRFAYVLCGDGWSAGIVGLVAGKLVTETGRPVFVCGKDGERIVGSGRSIEGFNVVAAMERAKEFLSRFGGHPQACGLTIFGDKNLEAFRASVEAYAKELLEGRDLRPEIVIDAELRASDVNWDLVDALEKLEPHGEGNARPRFLLRDLLVSSRDAIGKTGTHVRMTLRGDIPKEIRAIGFGMTERTKSCEPGQRVDIVGEIGINEWNGSRSIQVRLVDICLSSETRAKGILTETVKAVSL